VIRDRNRGGSFLLLAMSVVALFGVLLFLSFFLQRNEGYDPIRAGVAFLPLTLTLVATAVVSASFARPRLGPRPLVVAGLLLATVAMLLLTRLALGAQYASDILPSLVLLGAGLGLVFNNLANNATLGVQPRDAGVASATFNACQQVGGSLGTALLSTIAASATTAFLVGRTVTPMQITLAEVHGYTVAFAWSAGIFALAAVVSALLLTAGVPQAESVAERERGIAD
jgi:MFS family permease